MRSETADIAIELSLQPWRAFRPDGVIMFSDILTPLPALGIEFDVVKVSMGTPACRAPAWRSFHSKRNDLPASPCAQGKGPVIADPVRTMDRVTKLLPMDDPTTKLAFVGETLRALRQEVGGESTVLGFIGTPWTLAAYAMEGKVDK